MSNRGQGSKPEGKPTSYGGSHHKGGSTHEGKGGGKSHADARSKGAYPRLDRAFKLKMTDKDKLVPVKEKLKLGWSKQEFGELSLILDTSPAEMPKIVPVEVPSEMLVPIKLLKAQIAAATEQESTLRNELKTEKEKVKSDPSLKEAVEAMSEKLRDISTTKSELNEELTSRNRLVEMWVTRAMDLAIKMHASRADKCIAMIGDIRDVCDDTLLQQLEAHPLYRAAYTKRDPAGVWNALSATILAGLEDDPLKAFEDAVSHFTRLRQQDGEALVVYMRKVQAAFHDENAKRKLYYESEGIEYQEGPLDNEKRAASHFIQTLNRNYEGLKAEISNDHSKQSPSMPTTLGEALKRAQMYQSPLSARGEHAIYAYATDGSNDKLRQGGNKKGKGSSGKHEQKKAKAQPDKGKADDKAEDGKPRGRECFLCKSTEHWWQSCPSKDIAIKAVKDSKAIKPTALATHVPYEDDSDSDHPWQLICRATDMSAPDDDDSVEADAINSVSKVIEAVSTIVVSSYKDEIVLGLDSQANVNIFGGTESRELLRGLVQLKRPMSFNAASGPQPHIITHKGTFGKMNVYWGMDVKQNILANTRILECGGTIEQRGGIGPEQYYEVILPDGRRLEFTQSSRMLYECKIGRVHCAATTVNDRARELGLTKRELDRTELVRLYKQRLGHISTDQLIAGLNNGSIVGGELGITAADVKIFRALYGPILRYEAQGRMRNEKSKQATPDLVVSNVNQRGQCDLFFIGQIKIFIMVFFPMWYIHVEPLHDKTAKTLFKAITKSIALVTSRGYKVTDIRCDSESGIVSIKNQLELTTGVRIDPLPSGQKAGVVEKAVDIVKTTVRTIVFSLPFELSLFFMGWATHFAARSWNMRKHAGMPAPTEALRGWSINQRDFRVGTMEYCQVKLPPGPGSNSVTHPRSIGAISLCPIDSSPVGAVRFLNLTTGNTITSSVFKAMPMPTDVEQYMNEMARQFPVNAPELARKENQPTQEVPKTDDAPQRMRVEPLQAPPTVTLDMPTTHEEAQAMAYKGASKAEEAVAPVALADDKPDDVHQAAVEAAVDTVPPENNRAGGLPKRSAAIRHNYHQMDTKGLEQDRTANSTAIVMSTSQQRLTPKYIKSMTPTERAMMLEALKIELTTQMKDKKSIVPIDSSALTEKQRRKLYSSSVQAGIKSDASGNPIKAKARLVGGGHQNREYWDPEQTSSPTAQTAAVLMVACLAAVMARHTATMDFTAAYLNADMPPDNEGDPVVMVLDTHIAEIALMVAPEWKQYLTKGGRLYVKVDKAVYGFATSGKLWFDLLTSALKEFKFESNPEDPCVWNGEIDGAKMSIALHVDDMLITATTEAAIHKLKALMTGKFDAVTLVVDKKLDFLGMVLDFSTSNQVGVSTPGLEKAILADIHGKAPSPAEDNLFKIDETAAPLNAEEKALLHSNVMALLFMAKRSRPDILLAISFLTTRVLNPTQQDMSKLMRVMKYLNATRGKHVVLKPDHTVRVTAFIDASYAPHPDAKSHAGAIITLGTGPIYVRSAKTKLVLKSSTEAELVALSDMAGELVWTRSFLIGQGLKIGPALTYQDNKSTIILAERGKNHSPRTKHIAVRYFFIKDRIEQGDIALEYLPTDKMIADLLTKPLQGDKFRTLCAALLGME